MKDSDKILIELELYPIVKLLIESQYETEGIINSEIKESNRIIFKDREKAISMVREAIVNFSIEQKVDMLEVTYVLMSILEEKMKLNSDCKEEFRQTKNIVLMIDDMERY